MSNVRLRRLAADYAKLQDYVRRHPRLRLIQSHGDPPERYQVEYRIRSLRQVDGELQPVKSHIVEITLPLNYPRTAPQCRMLTPVFHPNIAPHAVCVGDHWSAGESLQAIVTRIGEMLAYQSYNVKSPLNGDAARWAEENQERLPLDPVSMLPEEEDLQRPGPTSATSPVPQTKPATTTRPARQTTAAPPPPPSTQPPSTQPPSTQPPSTQPPSTQPPSTPAAELPPAKVVTCPSCNTRYRLPQDRKVAKIRCRKCLVIVEVTAQ